MGEQLRSADRPERISEKLLCYAIRRHGGHVADGYIGIVGCKVKDCIRADHFERDIRAVSSPTGQARYEPTARESIGRGHPQRLLGSVTPHSGDCTGKCFEPVANDGKEARSSLGHCQGTRPTTKQRMAAIPLEQTDLMADRRRRNTEFVCGLLEAQVPRRGLKCAQLDQGWKLSHAVRVDEIHSAAHEIFAFAFAATEMEKG